MFERRRAAVVILTLCLVAVLAVTCGSFLSKAKNTPEKQTYFKYYTNIEIQPGDTLWDLAELYLDENYESREAYIEEVMKLNSLSDGSEIISGQYLILPYYSTEYKL